MTHPTLSAACHGSTVHSHIGNMSRHYFFPPAPTLIRYVGIESARKAENDPDSRHQGLGPLMVAMRASRAADQSAFERAGFKNSNDKRRWLGTMLEGRYDSCTAAATATQ